MEDREKRIEELSYLRIEDRSKRIEDTILCF